MKTAYYKEYSRHLNREMEFKVYGHGGKPCLVFPSQDGRFFDYENNGMIEAAKEFIDAGKIQFFCIDSIDHETWSDEYGDARYRIELHERYYNYVIEELVPRIFELNKNDAGQYADGLMTTGNSMGAAHCVNFFLRRPDIFNICLALSGIYDAGYFFKGYMDELVYRNSPVDYLKNLPVTHPYVDKYNHSRIVLCCGQGDWEHDMVKSTHQIQNLFEQKGIHAWFDYWGYDVAHDWCWWRRQLPYFLKFLLEE